MTHDIEVYATDRFDDALGAGLRIYTSGDAVYEARQNDDASVRIYPEGSGWHAKVQYDSDGLEDAYDQFSALAEDIEDAYGVSLDITPKAFMEAMEAADSVEQQDGRYSLTFREEPDIRALVDQPISGRSRLKGAAASMASMTGGSGAVGAALGAAIGIPGGPPAMTAGAAIGAMGAGFVGGIVGFSEALASGTASHDRFMWRSGFPTHRFIRFFEKRRRKKYVDDDRLAEKAHFDMVNRLNALDREMELADSLDLSRHEDYTDLEESGIDEVHDILMRTQFHAFEDTGGITASYEADTYTEAAAFAATLLDADTPEARPSIYTNPDVFKELFRHCVYTEDGETKLFGTGRELVRNVFDRDDTDGVIADWLEETYPAHVQEIGQEHALEGGSA